MCISCYNPTSYYVHLLSCLLTVASFSAVTVAVTYMFSLEATKSYKFVFWYRNLKLKKPGEGAFQSLPSFEDDNMNKTKTFVNFKPQ